MVEVNRRGFLATAATAAIAALAEDEKLTDGGYAEVTSPGAPLEMMQPVMGFEHGYCRPECTACGDACPAGAIRRLTPQQKKSVRIGHAVWNKDLCLAASEGVTCHACERHCLGKAITLVPLDRKDKKSPKVPKVDEAKCIGCGACEHLCPARPMPAMVVEGLARHN